MLNVSKMIAGPIATLGLIGLLTLAGCGGEQVTEPEASDNEVIEINTPGVDVKIETEEGEAPNVEVDANE
ncbi:MAG: hypothetical protein CMJ46_03605 [Planctomyces sp.]|nr:hypothetical protein [Planctomyces sp.]